jgi:hypothetical protein
VVRHRNLILFNSLFEGAVHILRLADHERNADAFAAQEFGLAMTEMHAAR